MRMSSFHFAVRSPRVMDPTLIWRVFQPTARCAMVTSSDSPERALTMVARPSSLAAVAAARACVRVPTWFGLTNSAVQAPDAAAARTRSALVTRKSSPTT